MNHQTIKIACSNCNMRELCMPIGLSEGDLDRIDAIIGVRKKIKRGESLYATGAGTVVSPGLLTFEGSINANDVIQAINLP